MVDALSWTLPEGQLTDGQTLGVVSVVNSVLVISNPRAVVQDGADGYRVSCLLEAAGFEATLFSNGM